MCGELLKLNQLENFYHLTFKMVSLSDGEKI